MAPVGSVGQTRPAEDPHPCLSDHMKETWKLTLKTRRCEQERAPITAENPRVMSPEVCGNNSCATSDRRAGGCAEAAELNLRKLEMRLQLQLRGYKSVGVGAFVREEGRHASTV